jgi:hypothetical protein
VGYPGIRFPVPHAPAPRCDYSAAFSDRSTFADSEFDRKKRIFELLSPAA